MIHYSIHSNREGGLLTRAIGHAAIPPCPSCGGERRPAPDSCTQCLGTGLRELSVQYEFRFPSGFARQASDRCTVLIHSADWGVIYQKSVPFDFRHALLDRLVRLGIPALEKENRA